MSILYVQLVPYMAHTERMTAGLAASLAQIAATHPAKEKTLAQREQLAQHLVSIRNDATIIIKACELIAKKHQLSDLKNHD